MSNSDRPLTPSASAEEIPVTPGFEEKLAQFWGRNRTLLIALCVVVLLVIVGRGISEYLAGQKLQAVQEAYAEANTPDELKQFASANDGHELAAVAWVQVADAAYADGKGSVAVENYQKAAKALRKGPLADRVSLGIAMSQIMAGKDAEGEAGLKTVLASSAVTSGVRVEAAYQLARLAHSNEDGEAVNRYIDQIMQIDPSSPWAQRVVGLRITGTPAAVAPTAPTGAEAKTDEDDPEPVIKLNLSGDK